MKIDINTGKSLRGPSASIALVGALVCMQPGTASAEIIASSQKNLHMCALSRTGDLEFAENGPEISVESILYVGQLYSLFGGYLHMWETAPDWTSGHGERAAAIATANGGQLLRQVWAPTGGVWGWVNITESFPVELAYNNVQYIDTDTAMETIGFPEWFVQDIQVVGQTPGDDTIVGPNCPAQTSDSHARSVNNAIFFNRF